MEGPIPLELLNALINEAKNGNSGDSSSVRPPTSSPTSTPSELSTSTTPIAPDLITIINALPVLPPVEPFRHYSDLHFSVLNHLFSINPYPNPSEYKALSEKIGMSMEQITSWFCKTRREARKNGITLPVDSRYQKFTETQVEELRRQFDISTSLKKVRSKALAAEIGLTPVQVVKWFAAETTRRNGKRKPRRKA